MAKEYVKYDSIYPSRRSRIKVPQNNYKHLIIEEHGRKSGRAQNAWWWILHRRGIYNPDIGLDPLEARAVPASVIRGTLPERIVYRKLVEMYFKPDIDFDFQSSLAGGRLELGGIVSDFLFPYLDLIIQVQGPTHASHIRHAKDEEQSMILASMGYSVANLEEEDIYDFMIFEEKIRAIFNLNKNFGNYAGSTVTSNTNQEQASMYDEILVLMDKIEITFEEVFDG